MKYTRMLCGLVALTAVLLAQSAPATLVVKGDVATPLSLTSDDLAKLPRETATVPAPDGAKIVYEGVTLFEVLQKAGAPLGKQLRGKAMATYLLARAGDGYQVAFTLGEVDPQFGNATILVADKRDGKPLPDKQGPFRIVCPNDKEGARSVRMLESLEVVRLAK